MTTQFSFLGQRVQQNYAIIAAALLAIGVFLTFFGGKFMSITLFFAGTGAVFGAVAVLLLTLN